MAKVYLDFVPPSADDIVKLHIYESADNITWLEIEQVTAVGSFPDYISHYTTVLATDEEDYFAIAWEDSKGATSQLSSGLKGQTTTVLGKLIQRVMQRDPGVNEIIVAQEAEAVLWYIFGATSPATEDVNPMQLSGLTYLVLARVYMGQLVSAAQDESYTAGLVQQKTSTGAAIKANVDQLLMLANRDLGLNLSVVMLMSDAWPLTSVSSIENDESRLALTVYRQ